MKKTLMIKAFLLLFAMMLFVIGWLSYRNFGCVTYTYELENTKVKSDYRFFQYVPGDRVMVSCEGAEKDLSVTTERLKNGTAVMIEGYGLGEETPVQNIHLTYYVDLLGLKAELPPVERYWNWVQEYHVLAWTSLNSARLATGNKAKIHMAETDVEYQFSLQNLIRGLSGVGFGIFTLLIGLRRCKIKWTESGRYATDFLERKKFEYDRGEWEEDQCFGNQYINHYVWEQDKKYLEFVLFLITSCMIFLPLAAETGIIYFMLGVCLVGSVFWFCISSVKSFKKLCELLSKHCRPQAAVMALTKVYGTRQLVCMRLKTNYTYQSLISTGLFYWGEFEPALEHLDRVWDEFPGYLRNSASRIHYHMLRLQCFQMLEHDLDAAQERRAIEDYLQKHPWQEIDVHAKAYRKQEKIAASMEVEDYEGAKQLLTEEAAHGNPCYQRVAAHYYLWYIAKMTKAKEQMLLHEDFIYQHGRETFFYSRVKYPAGSCGMEE